jgi:hypothetical protein
MASNRLLENFDRGVVDVPLPHSVIEMFGCRPGTTIRLHRVDGQLKVLPKTIPTEDTKSKPQTSQMWETCHNWWKKCGSSLQSTGTLKASRD